MTKTNNANVVYVRFKNGKEFPYLNDKFDLCVGDKVFVDGKFQGSLGVVTSVHEEFKVSLDYYKYVTAKPDAVTSGTFSKYRDYYISLNNSVVSAEKLLSWVKCPEPLDKEPEVFVCGKGCEIELEKFNHGSLEWYYDDFDDDDDLDDYTFFESAYLKFISVVDGVGKAAVGNKNKVHVIDFCFDYEKMLMTDIYCDCIKPNYCPEMYVVARALRYIVKEIQIDVKKNFSVIEQNLFNLMTSGNDKSAPCIFLAP